MPTLLLVVATVAVVAAAVLYGFWPILLIIPLALVPLAIWLVRDRRVADDRDRAEREQARTRMADARPRSGSGGAPASGEG